MPGAEELEHYLNEHLAGAASATKLVERCRSANEGTWLASYLSALGPEIEADADALRGMLERIGHEHRLKKIAGEAAERFSRARLAEPVTGDKSLTKLLELEALTLGVTGKLALWRSLKAVASSYPELRETEIDVLIGRADEQLLGLEEHRRTAAIEALTPDAERQS